MTKTVNEKWQFTIRDTANGPVLTGARKDGRGPWLHKAEIPAHVVTYLDFQEVDQRLVLRTPSTLAEYRESAGNEVIWNRTPRGELKGYCMIRATVRVKPKAIPKRVPAIRNLQDLVDHFEATDAQRLNRRIYKDTSCGASISVQTPDGKWHHNGGNWDAVTEIVAFTIQTIVEGSDATVDSDEFVLPVTVAEVDAWVSEMEAQADLLWREANQEDEGVPWEELTADQQDEYVAKVRDEYGKDIGPKEALRLAQEVYEEERRG